MAESKGDFALPVSVGEILLHRYFRVVAQHPFNHGCHFRRRAAFQLGVDTSRLFLYVPVDHDSGTPVARMPLGHQVLIPSPEFLGI